ncbi:XrtY-associated glycosyltransferase XYAG1 [uncultured Chitinophaga sp.]|uniref:XrtY-associated glycosyltransferase XYAG1 n=1 Tax=uncultured Chitinophaga sp. TaxID=339340 RepID=UPI0025F36F55|nr:glycosyltransferase [uncultured Chitinophaga sp.]
MKILFIVPSYKPAYIYGGPVVAIARLAEQLVRIGHEVTVYTTTANGKNELEVPVGEPVNVDGVSVFYFKRLTKDHTHVSPALWKHTWATVDQFQAVHIHSWWNFLILGASWICNLKGVKPVLSPHGMLCDWVFNSKNSLKKKVLHNAVGKHLLGNTFLHISSPMEQEECLRIHGQWDADLIHNLVALPEKQYGRKENAVFNISFLSRVDPKKGLDILLNALSGVSFPYKLNIAGSGDDEYVRTLKQIITQNKMEENVEWVGWKNNEEKYTFLAESDLFALTSHNENFAIVVIESLAVGTPVLVSNNVGLSKYVNDKKLGWVTGIESVDEVRANLTKVYNDREERRRISEASVGIIRYDFDEARLAEDYITMYRNSTNKAAV